LKGKGKEKESLPASTSRKRGRGWVKRKLRKQQPYIVVFGLIEELGEHSQNRKVTPGKRGGGRYKICLLTRPHAEESFRSSEEGRPKTDQQREGRKRRGKGDRKMFR